VCCPVTRCVTECVTKKVCVDRCKDVVETCYRDCVKKVASPVTTCKTVNRKCGEWVEESYCKPGRSRTVWQDVCECVCDPCTGEMRNVHRKCRVTCETRA